jgi:Uncharacterized protein conserved in bacteria
MNRNYQKELEQIIKQNTKDKVVPTLLLHSCCAPCSSYVLEYLSQYFKITVFYYNPNIYPDEEYLKRVAEQQAFIKRLNVVNPIGFIEGDFNKERFHQAVSGYEDCQEGQERCFICYKLRLAMTAKLAKAKAMNCFATTLSISPMKNTDKLNEIGEMLGAELGVKWLPSDFKKKNGYKRSIELSKEYGLYRQNYCGCVYSS